MSFYLNLQELKNPWSYYLYQDLPKQKIDHPQNNLDVVAVNGHILANKLGKSISDDEYIRVHNFVSRQIKIKEIH